MAFTLENYRTHLTTILSLSGTPEISDAELDRALNQAVAVLSRFFPRELIAQMVYNEDITDESVTLVAGTKAFANKPVRFGSETIENSGQTVTYARNTDYEMDYINGVITRIAAGDIGATDTLNVTYKLDGTMIDLSGSLLTEPTAIDRVDILRSDQVPQIFEGWAVHGDFLIITDMSGGSQQRFVDNDHIRIYYFAHHVEPAAGVSGSFPDHLDELVLIGASGYALLIESLQQEHLTVVDLASARTSIGNIAAIHTSIGTLVTDAATARTSTGTQLISAVAELVLANVELDKVAAVQTSATTELGTANTELDLVAALQTSASAEVALGNAELDKATSELAKVDVASGPVDDAETELALIIIALATGGDFDVALDKVVTYSEGATDSAKAALDGIQTELDLGNIALDNVTTELLSATRNADAYLDTGDALINAVNLGRNAADLNQRYATAKTNIATAFVQEAQLRFEHGNALAQEASQWLQTSQSFINEANTRLRAVEAKIQLAQSFLEVGQIHQATATGFIGTGRGYIETGLAYSQIAQVHTQAGRGFTENALGYIQLAQEYTQNGRGYIENALGYIAAAREYLGQAEQLTSEMNVRVNEIQSYLSEATTYHNSSEEQRASAEAFRVEAEGRLRDYFAALRDRAQINTHPRASSVRQYASDVGNQRRFLAWERQGTF